MKVANEVALVARMKECILASLAVALSAIYGCGMKEPPEVPVAEQWAGTIQNFSLIPIFPPREDVRVGDVRLSVALPVVERQLPYRDIGALELRDEIKVFYESRRSLPFDDKFAERNDAKTPWVPPRDADLFNIAAVDPADRPRLAALPGVTVATVTQGSLGARAPVGGVGQLGGSVSGSAGRTLSITIGGIEEIRAPNDYIVKSRYEEFCRDNSDTIMSPASLEFSLSLLVPRPKWNDPAFMAQASPQLAVLNKVYYFRSVDYTFNTQQGYGADIAAVLGPLSDLQALSKSLGTTGPAQPSAPTGKPDAAGSQAKEISDLVASLRSTISGSASPGIALSAVLVDSRGVTLRDVYVTPLAFAAQAIAFNASPSKLPTICSGESEPPSGAPLAPAEVPQ